MNESRRARSLAFLRFAGEGSLGFASNLGARQGNKSTISEHAAPLSREAGEGTGGGPPRWQDEQ
jgi:hypothetical protein